MANAGIWREIGIDSWSGVRIASVRPLVDVTADGTGLLNVHVEIERAGKGRVMSPYDSHPVRQAVPVHAEISGFGTNLSVDGVVAEGRNEAVLTIAVPEAKLWWPVGYGDQPLYDVDVTAGDAKEAFWNGHVGFRTVHVDTRADNIGRPFQIYVNDVPVHAHGYNWIPDDAFISRVSQRDYERGIRDLVESNSNMVRAWGGGIYESDEFYDLCDEYGIMVWQDFVFACNMYPGSAQIYADIRAEAEDNVRRLRNHPSLVLWCGNNEIDVAWKPHDKRNSRFRKFYTEEEAEQFDRVNETIFRNILPGVVDSLCGGTVPYWHSSPSPGWGLDTADRWRYGDVHNWDVWHKGDPISAYNTQIARFISEYGLQSYPKLSSVERFIPEGERRLASPSMTSHQGDRKKGDARMLEYVDRSYLRDGDFARTLYLSQLMQAEGMKTAMEAHRRNMPYCMGSLIWQLNDVWPCASWSGIDYYGRWKAMHYFVRKACEPVVVSPYIQGDTLDIFVVSDLRKPLRGVMKLTLTDFSGNELKSSSHPVTVGAAASQRALRYGVRDYLDGADPGNAVLVCEFRSDKTAYRALQYFETMKNAALPAAAVRIRAEKPDAATCRITVSSDKLAKNLTLHYKGTAGIFSDNYFDLLPGESRSVTLTAPEDAAEILRHIECMALNPETTIIKL